MSSRIAPDLRSIFAAQGVLASSLPNYRARGAQLEMAEAVASAIQDNGILIAEAGTGTGKTFAYLVPALLSGAKVIISTGTKTLQDQLFHRDIPALRNALQIPVSAALLKGRSNYVCHYRLERTLAQGKFEDREEASQVQAIARFAKLSESGDRAELAEVPESSSVWPLVTSTRDNCLGSECPHYKKCFVMAARRRAQLADLIVVNHHLFFADVWLRAESAQELLPARNTVIFDEAHQLPEIVSVFFGESVSTGQLLELARDARLEAVCGCPDFAPLPEAAAALVKSARDLRLVFGEEAMRLSFDAAQQDSRFNDAFALATARLQTLSDLLELQAERAEGLRSCWQRSLELLTKLERWKESDRGESVRWVELYSHTMQMHSTPLSIAPLFEREIGARRSSWIFTSATLSVNADFKHYQREMGLHEARTASWESPFDYPTQALLYVPRHMPDPAHPGYTRAVVQAALPVIANSQGRAFLLFTSLRAMRQAHELIATGLDECGMAYPLLVQGEQPRSLLLERFRRLRNPILIGSHSFWEGVDVRGPALSLVVIDKLPFQPPEDPVLAARISRLNALGRNAFLDYQLPQAVIALKQGAGRLIRDEADRGVLMICDPRLITRSYGRSIWQSLPPMRRTRELADVARFFESGA
jgi:ATP-dependent DNA helicase DinG